MSHNPDAALMSRMDQFITRVTSGLRDRRRRESFALYAQALLTDGERKSMEPMAARMCGCPDDVAAAQKMHDRMLSLVSKSQWADAPVRAQAVGYGLDAIRARGETIEVSIIDDTGFLKQGTHSPGVHRQYTGSAGKTANCQVAVSLVVASRSTHLPVDMALYLPEVWTSDLPRRQAAKIPDDINFQTKWRMALGMISRAKNDGVPLGTTLADSAYGDVSEFRAGLISLNQPYALAVHSTTHAVVIGRSLTGQRMSVAKIAASLPKKAFRQTTWRQGSARAMSSRFARLRVCVSGVEQTLLIEWPNGEAKPTDYSFVHGHDAATTKQMVRILKQRWRTERVYQDMKGELGLDHFEGRSYGGWNHHVTLALCCYAFVVAEQLRLFSLTTRGARWDEPLSPAA